MSQTLRDLKSLYQDKMKELDLKIKFLRIHRTEIDKELDLLNAIKAEIENIENELNK